MRQFWEHTFQCKFAPLAPEWVDAGGGVCTGHEELQTSESKLFDVFHLRAEYLLYKAVYALAHALHDMLQCVPGRGPFSGHSCATLQAIQPWQVGYQQFTEAEMLGILLSSISLNFLETLVLNQLELASLHARVFLICHFCLWSSRCYFSL